MRKIKFRGKRVDNGEWIYGDLIQSLPYQDGHINCWIKKRDLLGISALSVPAEDFIEVIPETVGQFTGLKDKNGKEIFEGDVVRSTSKMVNLSTNKPTGKMSIEDYAIIYVESEARFAKQKYGKEEHEVFHLRQESIGQWYEVIGNIHEHKELLV